MTHDQLQWEKVLATAGHRVTRQRTTIIDATCQLGGHTTIDEIYLAVRRQDRSIDRSTVYRTLALFVDLGLLLTAVGSENQTTYEIARLASHHHLVCRTCGDELEIDEDALRTLTASIEADHGFRIETDHLVLFGTCHECLAKSRQPTGAN